MGREILCMSQGENQYYSTFMNMKDFYQRQGLLQAEVKCREDGGGDSVSDN